VTALIGRTRHSASFGIRFSALVYARADATMISECAPRTVKTRPSSAVTRMVTSPSASMLRVTAFTKNSLRSFGTFTMRLIAL
jgi:hypothetical protein